MKRHEKLIPLSRFHRSCLFLALIAKENAPKIKGYPTGVQDKITYAISFYEVQLIPHFEQEELLWHQVANKSETLKKIIDALTTERKVLIGLFKQLKQYRLESTLFTLGELLEKHVRKEERILFQQIQVDLTEKELTLLHYE